MIDAAPAWLFGGERVSFPLLRPDRLKRVGYGIGGREDLSLARRSGLLVVA